MRALFVRRGLFSVLGLAFVVVAGCDMESYQGYSCASNADCAAGCYCSSGTCIETALCSTNADCDSGLQCDTTRSTCVPNPPPACNCTSDSDCAQGQYCAPAPHTCTASCTCTDDQQAIASGYGWCDTSRDTCMLGENPAGTCAGDVSATCSTAEPQCPSGSVPLLSNGCWNGSCALYAQCNLAPVCGHINDEMDCLSRSDCSAIYDGIDCMRPDGTACHTGDTNCTCQSYVFASCEAKTTTP